MSHPLYREKASRIERKFQPIPTRGWLLKYFPGLTRQSSASIIKIAMMSLYLRFVKATACLMCLVLFAFMTVEVAHVHPKSDFNGEHCQICAMAHIAVENHPYIFSERILHVLCAVVAGDPLPGSRAVVSDYFIRPPPVASCTLAL